jgi:hypothetical protein
MLTIHLQLVPRSRKFGSINPLPHSPSWLNWLSTGTTLLTYFYKVTIRPTVSRPVSLSVKPHLGPKTRFLLLWDSCCFADVGRPLWREDGSVICRGHSRLWKNSKFCRRRQSGACIEVKCLTETHETRVYSKGNCWKGGVGSGLLSSSERIGSVLSE